MKVRKGVIKKPKFLIPYFISAVALLAIFAAAAVIYIMPRYFSYEYSLEVDIQQNDAYLKDYFREGLESEELNTHLLTAAREKMIDQYCATGQRSEVLIDGKIRLDSSKTSILNYAYIANDGEKSFYYLTLADSKYLRYFETPEVMKYARTFGYGYSDYYTNSPKVEYRCNSFYADYEKGVFIPVEVEILDWHSDPTGVSFKIEPDNTEGFKFVTNDNIEVYYSQGFVGGYEPSGNEENVTWESDDFGNTYHYFEFKTTPTKAIHFRDAYGYKLDLAIVLICCGAFIFAFVPATIIYNVRLRRYQVYEYRGQMIDAMAHDLKTPMAAISAYAENLSNHIGTDKQEYYAAKVEEKVAQMNKMVNDILEFSKSEKKHSSAAKENVDLSELISQAISDNEHIISKRALKINYDKKSVTIKTDENLYRQALSNLIGNAVLYSREGSAIDITCSGKSLTIVNDPEEEIEPGKDLTQPFAKGSTARGNKGTGLGLAIAKNNLAMLGFKLEIKSDGGRFAAVVKM